MVYVIVKLGWRKLVMFRQLKFFKLSSMCIFLLAALSMLTFFLNEKVSRVCFYWCGYLSIISFIYLAKKKPIRTVVNRYSHPFIIMGSIYCIWSVYCKLSGQIEPELFKQAKRFILSFFIINVVLYSYTQNIIKQEKLQYLAKFTLFIAFILASIYAIYQTNCSQQRVLMGFDRATLVAYAYSFLSLAILCYVAKIKRNIFSFLLFNIIMCVSIFVIFHTETRAAMGVHTLLSIVIATQMLKSKNKSILFALTLAILFATVFCNRNIIHTRLNDVVSDMHLYKENNDRTSVGARFTMWEVGLAAFAHKPFGQSLQQRNKFIVQYLNSHGNKNSEALKYLDVHLHNEVIESASRFGIIGIIILIYFYYMFGLKTWKKHGFLNLLTIPVISLILYGLTDVLMLSVEMIVFITLCILLNLILLCPTHANRTFNENSR